MSSSEADGQEQSKGLSECSASSRASQFRLYASVTSLLRQGVCPPLNRITGPFRSGGSSEAERN